MKGRSDDYIKYTAPEKNETAAGVTLPVHHTDA